MIAPTTSSTLPVLDDALIERMFGQSGLKYLRNKHTGGTSGKKGTRYEDQFAAFKIAEALADHVRHGRQLPVIEEQALGFVDDLVVADSSATKYFQCKNSASVSWSGGDHPIGDDFKCQIDLATALQKPNPLVELVVAEAQTAENLADKIPPDIVACASVVHFPYFGSLNRLVLTHAPLREHLLALTRKEKPDLDDLEGAFSALLLAWIKVVGESSVEAIAQAARQQSPQLLRTFPLTDGEQHLLPQFIDALAGVTDLRYSVKRGFFSWTAEGFSETFTCECGSEEFARFQQRVIRAKPSNLDDFWELLP
ncbi:hypothetical protein [Paraburkholderia bryophila]|uniref:Uncharacterized protein n=1 Tax=Paraburkholderia bryophila TaxID=420952 RepID=A0A329C251_9BURK|nr:hypothetical protein [Paraburkholderia bryophila]RAS27942.1 hypothetical protein BX591_112152 [Paraburkholderia bryophila]